MEAQSRTCTIFVNYEGLLAGLSHYQCLEINSVLAELLQKARQQYRVLHALVLGSWLQQESREQLTELGYTCRAIYGSEQETLCTLQEYIAPNLFLTADEVADVFIFIDGEANCTEMLRQVCQVQKISVLWTLEPPSLPERLLCSEWEQVSYPESQVTWKWPRQVMLHALVLVADALISETGTTFSCTSLCEQLNQLQPFNKHALYWLTIAIQEQIISVPPIETDSTMPVARLNRQHATVQKTFLIKEHILMTVSSLLSSRDWIALSTLEKALEMTASVLTQNRDSCQTWLDLLVSTGALLTRLVPHPDGAFLVTTLSFNRDQQVLAILRGQETRNLQRLIIAANDFIVRREQQSIKRTSLARMLLKTMTSIEACRTLSEAMEQEIAHPVFEQFNASSIHIWLNGIHPLVQTTLNQRDQLILLCYTLLPGNHQISERALAEEFAQRSQVNADETLFWIYLLIDEGILMRDRTSSGTTLRMKRQDAVIKRALDQLN